MRKLFGLNIWAFIDLVKRQALVRNLGGRAFVDSCLPAGIRYTLRSAVPHGAVFIQRSSSSTDDRLGGSPA